MQNDDEILYSFDNYEIRVGDMKRLTMEAHDGWLNDNVNSTKFFKIINSFLFQKKKIVNFYCKLLIARNMDSKCVILNSFFFTKLRDNSMDQPLKHIDKDNKGIDSLDLIVFPLHEKYHWCLVVIYIKKKEIIFYDSFLIFDSNRLKKCFSLLTNFFSLKYGENFIAHEWTIHYAEDIPEQKNGYDCGVFMLQFAKYLTAGKTIDFTQQDIPNLRQEIMEEVKNKKI